MVMCTTSQCKLRSRNKGCEPSGTSENCNLGGSKGITVTDGHDEVGRVWALEKKR